MSNPGALAEVYYAVVNDLKDLSVDKVQNIATMCGVMCEVVLDAAEDIEKVTNEEFSNNTTSKKRKATPQRRFARSRAGFRLASGHQTK